MSESDTLRQELLLEQAITNQLDRLVRRASQTVLLLEGNQHMEVSQLRNLLSVAVGSRSLQVVINFIRYQIARNAKAWGSGPESFGHQVIKDLREEVEQRTNEALQNIESNLPAGTNRDELRKRAFVRIMLLYLGYLNRTFYAARRGETNSFQTLRGLLDA